MDGGLLGARRGAVDPDVGADHAGLGVLVRALVGLDEPAGPLVADLVVVVLVRRDRVGSLLGLDVRIRLRLLLGDPLLEGLAGGLLGGRVAEALAGEYFSGGEKPRSSVSSTSGSSKVSAGCSWSSLSTL